ncbi:hypothetical protein NVV93_03425 [Pseudomonas sp. LS44]|uniref:ShlB/FhaC/HecB family hemolysin secretion/activation protein n=1 Tax=Pseudomonas sp. LS44 TaxID=1357074 RepID=UPI00215A30A5|nr:POTRA domain-containing protein [Pseudomonas sp. LS44]UVE18467.1 hypothetical protein NVV93_03425 [Pseudomonas sp. LS44]
MLGLFIAGLANAAPSLPPGLPGQADPNLQREQIEQIQRQREIDERARRQQIPALKGEAAGTQQLPEGEERFVLKGIHFNPSSFIEQAELEAMARPYLGHEISFADLNALLREINQRYEKAGHLTARAVIPPQNLDNGVLSVVLVEAKVDQVQWIGGERRVDDDFYAARLPVNAGETLDSTALISAIQRFNATTPGPQVSASLAPGAKFGTSRVDLQAFEPDALQWAVFVNNYGNESSGREQYGGSLTWFSPTGVADALNAVVVATSASQYGSLRYSRPVNRYNGVAYIEAGANSMEVENGPYRALNIDGDSQTYGIGYDHPYWLDESWVLLGGVGYNHQNSTTSIDGFDLSDANTDEVFLKGQVEYRAAPWYLRYEQRLRQASADNAISSESGNYQLTNGDGYLSRMLGERHEIVGRFGWQYASDSQSLPSSLLYQFGGISSVRGYDPGVIASPQGATVNLEGYWHYSPMWQPFVFFDYGRAMDLGTSDIDLQSVGVGLNFNWGRHLSFSVVAANTLKDVVPDQDSGQVLAQLIIR